MNNPYATPDPPSDGYGSLEELRAATPQEQPIQAFPGDKHGVPPGPNPYATPDVAENPYAAGNPYATPDEVETKPGAWDRIKAQTAGVLGEIQGVDTYLRQGPKPDWSDVNAIPAGIIKAGDRAISAAVHFPAGVAEHYLGSDDKRDAHFNEIKNRAALTKLFTDEHLPTTGSKLSQITEGVAQLPYFLADKVLAAFSVTGNAVETTSSLLDQGVDFQTAVVVAGLQGGGDAALAMLPGMKGNPTVARLLAQGPVTGAGLNYIAYEMLMQKGHTEAAKAFDPRDPANIIPDLVGAGVAGKAARDNQKALAGNNVIKDKAQALLTARKEIRDLEAKMAEEAAAKGEVPPPEAPPITPVPPRELSLVPKEEAASTQDTDLRRLSTIAMQQAGELGSAAELTESKVPPADWKILKEAGLVQQGRTEDGQPYEYVDTADLQAERDRRYADERARSKVTPEERARGVERRAGQYDRLADEQDSMGELGDQALAQQYREKAAEIRGNQASAYELATGHKTEAPESPRIDAARLEDTTQPEVARTAPEPDVGFKAAFDSLKGGGTTEHLYSGLFKALQDGKDTYAGIKDPVLSKAKPAFDAGQIKDAADLRSFIEGKQVSEEFIRSQSKEQGGWVNPFGKPELPPSIGRELPNPNQKFGRNDNVRSEDQANRALTPNSGISDAFRRSNRKESGMWNPFAERGVSADEWMHGTTAKNAEAIASEGKFRTDVDPSQRVYSYSEFGRQAVYFTKADGWWLDKKQAEAGRAMSYEASVKAKLDPKAKIFEIRTPKDLDRLAKKAGLKNGKELMDELFLDGLTDPNPPAHMTGDFAKSDIVTQKLIDVGVDGIYVHKWDTSDEALLGSNMPAGEQLALFRPDLMKPAPVKVLPNGVTVTKEPAANEPITNDPESTQTAALTNDGRRVVFKGQAGAAHVDLISGGMASVADKIASAVRKPSDSNSPLAKPDQQREAMSKIPGQSDLKNHVSKDIPPDTVIAKLRELGKDMKPHWDWIGGPELTGWIKDNPMVYAMSSWWGNGHDRHNLNNKEVIVPLEHQISKLVRTGKMYDVMAVRQAEMYAKERLSAEDLAKIGMSPEQIAVHQEMTRQFDAQLARTNEILRSQNRPEIAAHEAYSASQRRGNWKTPVYDKKGKIVGFVQETSKGRAHYALKRIAKAHPDVDISKSKPEMDMSASDGTSRFAGMDNFTALNKILGSDHPLVQEIRSTQDQMIREMGTNVLGFDKHMLPKTGARYAFGEQPWKTDHQNIIDWAEGQVAYLRDASLWSELQQAATNTKLVLNDPTLKADQPMTLQWARDKMNSELGYGARPAVRKMERILSKNLGELAYTFSHVFPPLAHVPTDMRSINQGIGVGKAIFYIQKLGFFNGKFMGISLMQPAYAVSHHMRLSNEGYRHNPIQTLAEAQWMSSVALMGHYSPSFSKKVDPHLSKTLSNAIKYMEANGIANINQMSEVGDLDQSPTMRVLTEGAQFSISQPERIARTEVFMTFVSHLNQAKARGDWKGTEHEMFQKAEEVMTMVMGNYNHNDRAMVFNKLGAAGGALNALKTYPLNMAGQMVGFAKDGVRGNGYSPLMAQIGIGLALAGSMGIMGREYIEGLWDWLLEGYVAAGFSDPAVINFSPLKVMLEMGEASGAFGLFSEAMNAVGATSEDKDKLAKGLQYGLPSVATGRDLSGSLGNQGPEPTVDGMLPWLADFSKQSHKVGTFLLDKDQRSADRAIHALSPSSVQGNLEMSLPTMTNPDRPNLQLPINNPDMAVIERTQKMIDAKKTLTVPTNTIEESDARKILYKKQQNEKFFNKAKINVAEKFNAAVFQGHGETELKRLLTRYTELDGDPDTLINGVDKKAEARMMTFMERLGEAATTDTAALKYKRYKEAWDRRIQEKK